MIELIKDSFLHFDLLGFKESDIVQFNEMLFETNEFGRFRIKEGCYEFLSNKMGMYSDIDELYIDNLVVKPNLKGLKLIRIDFKFISYLKYSNKSKLTENYFNEFVFLIEESYSLLNGFLNEKGYDIRFENPLVGIKPDDCIHTIRRNKFEFLVEYSTFILGEKTLNRYKKSPTAS
jgi:hypothetical protein